MTTGAPASGKARRTYIKLVEATCAEIEATGSFSAERVAARAGASVATFYAYFSSKDAALAAAFTMVLERLVDWVDRSLSVERLLEKGIGAFCREFVVGATDFFTRESLVFRRALAQLPESRALRDAYREHERLAFERYEHFLVLAQEAGKVRRGDPTRMARALLVLSQGFNNPLVLGLEAGDPLLGELTEALIGLLSPARTVESPVSE